MKRWAALVFWCFSFVLSMLTLVYLAGFVLNRYAFSTIDSGLQIPEHEAALIDTALLLLFGLQHSGMARRFFKKWFSPGFERSVYLFATAFVLIVLFIRWEPIPAPVWFFPTRWPFQLLLLLSGFLVLSSAVSQGALHFLGFHQAWAYFQGRAHGPPAFRAPGLYRYSRHPMMIGTLLFLWSTHDMTRGHLLFSAVMTIYVLLAVRWEERDLEHAHGGDYARYRGEVGRWIKLK